MRRFLAVLLVICIFFTSGGCSFFKKKPAETEYSAIIAEFESSISEFPHYYSQLSEIEKAAYISVVKAINASSSTAQVPELNTDSFKAVTTAVSYDNPHFLWLSKEWTITHYSSGASIEIPYLVSAEERQNMAQELDAKVNRIFNGINDSMSDYDKELYFHDYLVSNCQYDNSALSDNSTNAFTAYGALVEGKAVCEGYARAMQLLLSRAGIDSFLIPGTAFSATGNRVSHMWNAVKINSEWYHLDATWNDPQNTGNTKAVWHTYFNLSDIEILRDHSYETVTNFNSTSANYHRKNSVYFTSFDSSHLTEVLADEIYMAKRKNLNFVELRFENQDDFSRFERAISNEQMIYIAIARIRDKYGITIKTSTISYSTIDTQLVVGIKFV